MSTGVVHVIVLATILASVFVPAECGPHHFRLPPTFGCSHGRKDGLFRHKGVSACKGAWTGHVENSSPLCSPGWHVCTWNDSQVLGTVTWYEATHIDGCYAINAAHNDGQCSECNSEQDHLAGIGADCRYQSSVSRSCFGVGKIDVSRVSGNHRGPPYEACTYQGWMSGVLCCREQVQGTPPKFISSPVSVVRVPVGDQVTLTCQASGDPTPTVVWFKNGYRVTDDEDIEIDVTTAGGLVTSQLTVSAAQLQHKGLYLCRATNEHGYAISYTSEVTVLEPVPDLMACRNKEGQHLLHGGELAACEGKWKGVVKRATKHLCAPGWRVCGLRDMKILHRLMWAEVTSLAGCYAYDAATTNHFACTKCSRRRKGNRMAGMGSGCGNVDRGQSSCLNKGRIGVWAPNTPRNGTDEFDVGPPAPRISAKTRGSCKYKRGITTGVMCCKSKSRKNRDPVCDPGCENGGVCKAGNVCKCPPGLLGYRCEIAVRGKRCKKPCGANSHCNRHGVCKCEKGFKSLGEKCVARNGRVGGHKKRRQGRCSAVVCLNGGRCKRGQCRCRPQYTGARCERASPVAEFVDIH